MLTDPAPPDNTGTPGVPRTPPHDHSLRPLANSASSRATDTSAGDITLPARKTTDSGLLPPDAAVVPPEADCAEPDYDATVPAAEQPLGTLAGPEIETADGRPTDDDDLLDPGFDPSADGDGHSKTAIGMSAVVETGTTKGEEVADDVLPVPDGRPRSGRQKNPVTRQVLRENFGDGKWRTPADMAVRLWVLIPLEVAAREVLNSPRIMTKPLADRIHIGQSRLVRRAMGAAVRSGDFESRKITHGTTVHTEYRYRTQGENRAAPTSAFDGGVSSTFTLPRGKLPGEDWAAVRPDERSEGDTGPVTIDEMTKAEERPEKNSPNSVATTMQPTDREPQKGAGGRAASCVSQTNDIARLLAEIRAEQRKIDRNEGNVIASKITIGTRLAALKAASGRTWGRQQTELGYNPRLASRLMKLAQGWGSEIGRIASDLLPKLPPDLNKLEWLCRLDAGQLRALLAGLDARKASRKEIVSKVRDALGEEPPPAVDTSTAMAKSIDRTFDRLGKTLERLHGEAADAGHAHEVRAAIAAGFARMLASLGPADGEGAAG